MLLANQNRLRMFAVVVLLGGMMPAAHADDDDERHEERSAERHSGKYGGENRGKPIQPAQINAKFQQECSSCHIAYSPGLLPAASWRKVMGGLDKHFGTDASLTDQENKEITTFLVNNASNRWSASTAPLRITESAWFKRKHDDREISPSVWKNPKVKSPANCGACHTQAESGNYSERNIRIPK
jgi:hypothetical protein